jgi:hypothetical protein
VDRALSRLASLFDGKAGLRGTPLEEVYDYFRRYDTGLYRVVACQGNEPSEEDVAAFERACGFRLPDEFRRFTRSALGGLYMEVREEHWPRAAAYDVGPFWSFLYAVKVFGIASDIPDWLDIRVQYAQLRDEGFPHLVPFLQLQGDANMYCFDRGGRIVLWDHEQPEEQAVQETTFAELLMNEIRDLEDRTRRKMQGEDGEGS